MQTDFGLHCWHGYFGSKIKIQYKRSLKLNSQSGCIYFVTIINWSASRKKTYWRRVKTFSSLQIRAVLSRPSFSREPLVIWTNKGSDLCAGWYGPPVFADMLNNLFARRCLIGTEDWILSPRFKTSYSEQGKTLCVNVPIHALLIMSVPTYETKEPFKRIENII